MSRPSSRETFVDQTNTSRLRPTPLMRCNSCPRPTPPLGAVLAAARREALNPLQRPSLHAVVGGTRPPPIPPMASRHVVLHPLAAATATSPVALVSMTVELRRSGDVFCDSSLSLHLTRGDAVQTRVLGI